MKSFLVFINLIFLCLNISNAQYNTQKHRLYTPTELQVDLQLFKEHLLKVHPGLDTYTAIDTIRKSFDHIESQLNKPMSDIDFYRLLTPLHALIGNGHTEFLPSAQFLKYIGSTTLRFPFDVHFHQDSLYVLHNLSDEKSIHPGDKIISINGQSTQSIVNYLIAQQTRDGYNLTLPIMKINNSFKTYYTFHYGLRDSFDLVIQKKEGDCVTKIVSGQTLQAIKKSRNTNYPDAPKAWPANGLPPASFKIEKAIATMTVRTMGVDFFKESEMDYHTFFKSAFEEIKQQQVNQLIVDLRGNHGGDSEPGIALMAHLLSEKFDYYTNQTTLVNKVPNPKYYKGANWLVNLIYKTQVRKYGDIYQAKALDDTQNIQPLLPTFNGQIYVLTDGNSFSAAGELAGMLKSYTNALFIGEETGGNPVQNVSSVTLPLTLPNTGVRVMMPFVLNETNVSFENDGRGVIPDYAVKNTIYDLLNKRDAVMELALSLANRFALLERK